MGFWPALFVDSGIWVVWSVAVGWWEARRPWEDFSADGWLTRLRPWERDGNVYAHLGVRRWKGRLPDLGPLWGGSRKRLERPRDPGEWGRMAGETRRAETVHWLILCALPVEACIGLGWVLAPMTAFAVVANVPCIVAQRHNRGRLQALGRRRLTRRADR